MEKKVQPSPVFCAHLGLLTDPQTSLTYPSLAHHCFHCSTPTVPHMEHQENYCLTPEHQTCPVFIEAQKKKFPAQYQAKKQPAHTQRINFFILFALFLLLGALFLIGLPTLAARLVPEKQNPSLFVTTQNLSPTKTAQPTHTSQPPSATPLTTKTATSTPTTTAKPTRSATPALHQMEIPIQVGNIKFLIHRILPGETLEKLIKTYTTSVDVVNHINYRLASPLWADSIVVLMPGVTTADPSLPPFEAYEITGTEISIEDLAQKLKIDATTLKYYNDCASGCSLFARDWILIPH